MEDDGAQFICAMTQSSENNDVIFEEERVSDRINLVYLDVLPQDHSNYELIDNHPIYVNVTLHAKPEPLPEQISWQILDSDLIQLLQPDKDVGYNKVKALALENLSDNHFLVPLMIGNISNDINGSLIVTHDFGEVIQPFHVTYIDPQASIVIDQGNFLPICLV